MMLTGRRTAAPVAALLAAAAALLAGRVAGAAEKSAEVEARLRSPQAAPGGRATVTVTLTPAPGVKLYRHQTGVTLVEGGRLELGEIRLPEGRRKFDESFGMEVQLYERAVSFDLDLVVPEDRPAGKLPLTLRVGFQGCTDNLCYPPDHQDVGLSLEISERPATPAPPRAPADARGPEPAAARDAEGEQGWVRRALAGGGMLAVLAAYVAGLLVAFTPCVYPMVPVTVALIGGAAAGRGGARRQSTLLVYTLVYVLGISITYAVLGALAASVGNVMQKIMQFGGLLAFIGLVMAALSLSMFGAFELQLPAAVTGRLGRMQGAGSLPMLLLSGVVLGLVASPCVSGPIAFLLVTIGQGGNVAFGAASMFAFAWGMSTLLIVAGLFPGLLGRPGPWMIWVKAVFGIVMALAGLYFVRTVLPLAAFSLVATALSLALGLVLLAESRRLAESGAARRWTAAGGALFLVIAAYLGFGTAVRSGALVQLAQMTLPPAVAAEMCPRDRANPVGVDWTAFSPEALETARTAGRPVIVDFYADWCSNCNVMEREVFTDRRVVAELERFVRLRVDGSTGAPKGPVRSAERRFSIAGYPTIILFGAAGQETARVVGAVPADSLLAKLREVR